MASFYAELQVAGHTYRVWHCQYTCQQATDARGRVSAKVRHAPLQLLVDVADDDVLLAWALAPHKPLAGQVVFYDIVAQVPHETIAFAAGECVSYDEEFESGSQGDGAYRARLTITAPAFELKAGGPAVPPAVAQVLQRMSQAEVPTPGLSSVAMAAGLASAPEYTLEEFKKTIWGADQVAPAIIEDLYKHFNAAKASADPAPHWAAMEALVRSTTYPNQKSGLPEILNGGWPPANGGFNKRLVQPAPPDVFDRYQKTVKINEQGLPILEGTFTSPLPKSGAFDYEARALEGDEKDYDLMYEIEVLKPLPFQGEEADIIPWHGHKGNGIQTRMLFPPKDPVTGAFPWNWQKLEREGFVKITYKSSPSGKFTISPDGDSAKPKVVK